MKSKRLLSLFLSAMLTLTSLPLTAATVGAVAAPTATNHLEGATPVNGVAKTDNNKYLHFYNRNQANDRLTITFDTQIDTTKLPGGSANTENVPYVLEYKIRSSVNCTSSIVVRPYAVYTSGSKNELQTKSAPSTGWQTFTMVLDANKVIKEIYFVTRYMGGIVPLDIDDIKIYPQGSPDTVAWSTDFETSPTGCTITASDATHTAYWYTDSTETVEVPRQSALKAAYIITSDGSYYNIPAAANNTITYDVDAVLAAGTYVLSGDVRYSHSASSGRETSNPTKLYHYIKDATAADVSVKFSENSDPIVLADDMLITNEWTSISELAFYLDEPLTLDKLEIATADNEALDVKNLSLTKVDVADGTVAGDDAENLIGGLTVSYSNNVESNPTSHGKIVAKLNGSNTHMNINIPVALSKNTEYAVSFDIKLTEYASGSIPLRVKIDKATTRTGHAASFTGDWLADPTDAYAGSSANGGWTIPNYTVNFPKYFAKKDQAQTFTGTFTLSADAAAYAANIVILKDDGGVQTGTYEIDNFKIYEKSAGASAPLYECTFDYEAPEGNKYEAATGSKGMLKPADATCTITHDYTPIYEGINYVLTDEGALSSVTIDTSAEGLDAGVYTASANVFSDVNDGNARFEVTFSNGTTLSSPIVSLTTKATALSYTFKASEEHSVTTIKLISEGEVGNTFRFTDLSLIKISNVEEVDDKDNLLDKAILTTSSNYTACDSNVQLDVEIKASSEDLNSDEGVAIMACDYGWGTGDKLDFTNGFWAGMQIPAEANVFTLSYTLDTAERTDFVLNLRRPPIGAGNAFSSDGDKVTIEYIKITDHATGELLLDTTVEGFNSSKVTLIAASDKYTINGDGTITLTIGTGNGGQLLSVKVNADSAAGFKMDSIPDSNGAVSLGALTWNTSELNLTKGSYNMSIDLAGAVAGDTARIEYVLSDGSVVPATVTETTLNAYRKFTTVNCTLRVRGNLKINEIRVITTVDDTLYFNNATLYGTIIPEAGLPNIGILMVLLAKMHAPVVDDGNRTLNIELKMSGEDLNSDLGVAVLGCKYTTALGDKIDFKDVTGKLDEKWWAGMKLSSEAHVFSANITVNAFENDTFTLNLRRPPIGAGNQYNADGDKVTIEYIKITNTTTGEVLLDTTAEGFKDNAKIVLRPDSNGTAMTAYNADGSVTINIDAGNGVNGAGGHLVAVTVPVK